MSLGGKSIRDRLDAGEKPPLFKRRTILGYVEECYAEGLISHYDVDNEDISFSELLEAAGINSKVMVTVKILAPPDPEGRRCLQ